jgi:ribosomal protein L35AE/L33A
MPTLHIEHPTQDFDTWKRAFDSDPAGRQRSGVLGYRVSHAVDDPNYVMIDLEFDTQEQAEGLLRAMQAIWGRPDHRLTHSQQARIVEKVEMREL